MTKEEERLQAVSSCYDALKAISAHVDAVHKLSTDAAIDCLTSRIREHIEGSVWPLFARVSHEALANAVNAAEAAKAEGLTTDD